MIRASNQSVGNAIKVGKKKEEVFKPLFEISFPKMKKRFEENSETLLSKK